MDLVIIAGIVALVCIVGSIVIMSGCFVSSEESRREEREELEKKISNADTCVVCGAIIPEGRQVCPICEN